MGRIAEVCGTDPHALTWAGEAVAPVRTAAAAREASPAGRRRRAAARRDTNNVRLEDCDG
jgi:hypothetical protein